MPKTDEKTKCLEKLDVWQLQGLLWMMQAEKAGSGRGFVIADRMGSGKTHQSCALLKVSPMSDAPTLVICPSPCVVFWRDALRWMTGTPPYVMVPGCTANLYAGPGDVVVASHSFFKTPPSNSWTSAMHAAELLEVQWARVIVDEAHKVLRDDSMSRRKLDKIQARVRWALSGCSASGATPRHFNDVSSWTGSRHGDVLVRKGLSSTTEVRTVRLSFATEREAAMSSSMHAVREEVGRTMEATLRCRQICADINVFVNAVRVQAAFGESESKCAVKCAELVRQDLLVDVGDVRGTKVRYITDTVLRSAPDERFVIFCSWRREVDEVYRALFSTGVKCVKLTGNMSATRQTSTVDAFDDDDAGMRYKALILTMSVGVAGLNLQAADHVIVTSPQFDRFTELQAAARVDRKGQTKETRFTRLVIEGTVDEEIYIKV